MSAQKLEKLDARYSARLRVAEDPGLLRLIAAFLAHSGDSWFCLLGLGLLLWLGTPYWQMRAFTMIAGIIITAILVMLIKFTVRRQRPKGEWGSIYRNTDPHSFPSGHSARTWMLTTLAVGLGPFWLAALFFVWSLLVGWARVSMGVHYLTDVLAGWFLGVVMGLFFLWLF
ncbi:MAG: phosphatase PAP2 family protein [Chloroflexota bacterium]